MSKPQPQPQIFSGDLTDIDTTAKHALGTKTYDGDGNEYIYLQGVASTAANDFVTYDEAFLTTRLVANAVGPVGVAMAATVASTYGWYQIWGSASGATDAVADNAVLYIDATAGRVDDSAVTGDLVIGAITRSTDASTNVATVQLSYPYVTNTLG